MKLTKQPRTFVIALKQYHISISQVKNCLASAKTHGWDIEIFWGTNGNTLTLDSWDEIGVKPLLHKGSMDKLGTWGCFFSHWRLWNLCVELNEPIVILEHDAIIECPWKEIDISDSLIKLHEPLFSDDPTWKYPDPDSGWGTCSTQAYCITPEHATKLISFTKNVGGFAADRILGSYVIDVKHTYPSIVSARHIYSTTANL